MMGKRLKEIFGLILINITLVSGSLNAETVYADTQAKIEIEKTEMPLKICVDEENKKTVLQIVAAWKKIYKNNGVELMVIPSGQQASEEKVQEIQNEITTGEGPDVFFAEGSLVDRREKDTRQRKRAFDRRPVALDGHRAVEHDPADLLLLKAILIDRKHPGNVPRETPHQRTVRIVRDGAQHRPHDTAFEPETAVGADTVAQDGGNPQSAHFDMVPVRIALADIPHDGRAVGNHLPAGLRTGEGRRRQTTEKRQEKAADADHGVGVFVFKISRIISNLSLIHISEPPRPY